MTKKYIRFPNSALLSALTRSWVSISSARCAHVGLPRIWRLFDLLAPINLYIRETEAAVPESERAPRHQLHPFTSPTRLPAATDGSGRDVGRRRMARVPCGGGALLRAADPTIGCRGKFMSPLTFNFITSSSLQIWLDMVFFFFVDAATFDHHGLDVLRAWPAL